MQNNVKSHKHYMKEKQNEKEEERVHKIDQQETKRQRREQTDTAPKGTKELMKNRAEKHTDKHLL